MSKTEPKVNCTSTLFFARLGSIKQQDLRNYCEKYGDVKDVTIITDPKTNKSKGCGFVKFVTHLSAKKCLEASQKHNEPNKKGWVVEWAKSTQIKEIDLDKFTLYITGITKEICTEENLRNRFSKYGTIESITIPTVNGNVQYAFICFQTTESAAEALNNENGSDWDGNVLICEYSEATESKRIRRQKASMKKLGFTTDMFNVISPIISPIVSPSFGFDNMNYGSMNYHPNGFGNYNNHPNHMNNKNNSNQMDNDEEDHSTHDISDLLSSSTPTKSSSKSLNNKNANKMNIILRNDVEEENEIDEDDILDILLNKPKTPITYPISKSPSPFWDMGSEDEDDGHGNLEFLERLRKSNTSQNDDENISNEIPGFVETLLK